MHCALRPYAYSIRILRGFLRFLFWDAYLGHLHSAHTATALRVQMCTYTCSAMYNVQYDGAGSYPCSPRDEAARSGDVPLPFLFSILFSIFALFFSSSSLLRTRLSMGSAITHWGTVRRQKNSALTPGEVPDKPALGSSFFRY